MKVFYPGKGHDLIHILELPCGLEERGGKEQKLSSKASVMGLSTAISAKSIVT